MTKRFWLTVGRLATSRRGLRFLQTSRVIRQKRSREELVKKLTQNTEKAAKLKEFIDRANMTGLSWTERITLHAPVFLQLSLAMAMGALGFRLVRQDRDWQADRAEITEKIQLLQEEIQDEVETRKEQEQFLIESLRNDRQLHADIRDASDSQRLSQILHGLIVETTPEPQTKAAIHKIV
eukprot:TRINITY_DN791_c0_g1_i2.p1 TRINITY_DN791_c0_g1~~TRINITY_DN791_c0_g1_i2.p1  ORF type:complete len:180 (-),score=29.18 TRINITY_DN791_c0_g1_i2:13-552(-)